MYTVDHFGDKGWFKYDHVIIYSNVFCVFVGKATYTVQVKKMQFLGFLFHKVMLKH